MHPDEYAALARVEGRHWFYSGKRRVVRHWLGRSGSLGVNGLLVDVGAGTGLFASEIRFQCRTLAVDPDPHATQFIRSRVGLPAVAASANRLPLTTGAADALTALDVIEHLDDDVEALAEFTRVVRPGGVLVLTVPALPMLWSEWDEALHHRRRYTRPVLEQALRGLPVEIQHLSYINTLALIPIAVYRIARRIGVRGTGGRLEDHVPPEPLNWLLRAIFVQPALLPISVPIGVSLLCVLRRRMG
jgi:SAM-dependent methyltransferase